MKIKLHLFVIVFAFGLVNTANAQTYADHRAVPAYAETNKTASTITLKWEVASNASSYAVYRRAPGASNWGAALATLGPTNDSYVDNGVQVGTVYEYMIVKNTTLVEPFSGSSAKLQGYSYITAAIEKAPTHTRGKLWILIAQNLSDSLSDEIATLKQDLAGDGWDIGTEVINSSAKVADVKSFIDGKAKSTGCDAVYLLGNIPVPYSGTFCRDPNYLYPPDGHAATDPNSHCGAWPADVYYGVLDGNWTDTDSTTIGKRDENKNLIGDGKWDNNRIPGDVTIAVGRVDLSRMPAFGKTEIELTRNYLNKVHKYKIGETQVFEEAVVENNFSGFEEGFSSGAIRDFTAHLGEGKIKNADMFTTTALEDYKFSYVCGGGSYTSCNGVGNTNDFTTKNAALFNHIFGSFFGDYDIQNNFMRASIATEKMGLICIWSGRPKWVTHSLAMGESFADCYIKTQNNFQDYDANFYQNSPHLGLMGDPSLRTSTVLPASNIALNANGDSTAVTVNWDASTEPGLQGYYVYRSHKPFGGYVLINNTPISSTSFIDNNPYDGTNHYMVRTSKITTTGSGSYVNLSIGVSAEINGMKGDFANINTISKLKTKVYPTLANTNLIIETETNAAFNFEIVNSVAEQVKSGELNGSINSIQIAELTNGLYFLKANGQVFKFVKY
ncbi:MAG: hypothetical protein RLZZ337_1305 [Bacteroidota bacterium]